MLALVYYVGGQEDDQIIIIINIRKDNIQSWLHSSI